MTTAIGPRPQSSVQLQAKNCSTSLSSTKLPNFTLSLINKNCSNFHVKNNKDFYVTLVTTDGVKV